MAQYKNYNALDSTLNKNINVAVENACNRLLGALQEIFVAEFNDVFEPDYYNRTYQFWKSASTRMLNQNCYKIFMNQSAMNYDNFRTDEKQLQATNMASPGSWITNEAKEHRLCEFFEEYCKKNALTILKEELRKQHINLK